MSEENVANIIKSDSNFAPDFVEHQVSADINVDGQYLINI